MNRLRFRFALAGLAGVLVLLAAFGIGSALRTDRATQSARAATALSDAYARARFAVGEEESLERKYRLEPSREVRVNYDRAAGEFEAALREVAATGGPADRALVGRLLDVQRDYLRAIDRMFVAVDDRDTERVLAIDADEVDPRFATIERRVDQAAGVHQRVAARALIALRGTERSVLTATPPVFAFGLLLLAFFAVMLARINRQLARQARASEHDALHDALTGLPNRVLFSDRLAARARARRDATARAFARADPRPRPLQGDQRHARPPASATCCCARSARGCARLLRAGDTVARLGGDEFASCCPATAGDDAQDVAAQRARRAARAVRARRHQVDVDASVGIALFPEHGDDAETLLQRADVAMYVAKARRPRRRALRRRSATSTTPTGCALIGELRRAIDDDELVLHYQPKVDLRRPARSRRRGAGALAAPDARACAARRVHPAGRAAPA